MLNYFNLVSLLYRHARPTLKTSNQACRWAAVVCKDTVVQLLVAGLYLWELEVHFQGSSCGICGT